MSDKWIVFDLIGVLAEPSWRDLVDEELSQKWESYKLGREPESAFWDKSCAAAYRRVLSFRSDRLALVRDLKKQGWKICVATNFSQEWLGALLDKIGEETLFDASVVSSRVGVAKPAPDFYTFVSQIVPSGSVFVDDREANCDAAAKAGFCPIWAYTGLDVGEAIREKTAA